MENRNGSNSNGEVSDDHGLAADLDDWIFAGRGLFRCVERLGHSIPPFGANSRAEVGQLIAATDAEFDGFAEAWQAFIRPALKRHENHEPGPDWLVAAHGAARHIPEPEKVDNGEYVDGAYVGRVAAAGEALLERAEKLRDCIPPADEGVAWSISLRHLPRVDESFGKTVAAWAVARPRLQKYQRRPTRW